MRPLVVNTFVTLDGVMQAPGGPEEDPEGGFAHGGWSVGYWDEAMGERMGEFMGRPYDLLLGRKTYEIFAAHWPKVEAPEDGGLNAARKYVASRTLATVEWNNSALLEGDVAEAVAALKTEDGPEIQVHGSGNLLQTLFEHDLIDRLQLMIFPVVLGTGKRLFGDGTVPAGLKLVDSSIFSSGVILTTYEREGDVRYGTFALEEPTEAEWRVGRSSGRAS
jgi:dihydrofolate reductase